MAATAEDFIRWANETLAVAVHIGASEKLPQAVAFELARRESLAILEKVKSLDGQAENAYREFAKLTLRRATAILNDGIEIGVVS